MQSEQPLIMKFEQVSLTKLKPGPNVRKEISQEKLATLAASLRVRQWQPILVTPDMIIFDGWCRFLSAQLAQMDSLWAAIISRPLSDDERIQIQLEIALHRSDFTEQEKVAACEELLAVRPDLDQKRLAESLHTDPATICKWLSVSAERVIPEVREAFFSSKIGLKAVYPISQVPKSSQAELLKLAIGGATREQLTTEVHRLRKPAPKTQVSRVRCVLPDGGTVTLSGSELSVDSVICQLADLLREARTARQKNWDIKTWERVLAARVKAANTDRLASES